MSEDVIARGPVGTVREKYPADADLPFIFLSALADRTDVIAGKKIGADDYLSKPIDFDLMLATVEARVRQISRMQTRKRHQLVSLYRALTTEAGRSSEDGAELAEEVVAGGVPAEANASGEITVVTVANDEIDLGDLHKALEINGRKIIKMNSGRKFLKLLDRTHPDLVMISRNTTDLPAKLVVRLIKDSMNVDFPIFLLVQRNPSGTPSPDGMCEFEDCIELPCSKSDLMKKIARLSAA